MNGCEERTTFSIVVRFPDEATKAEAEVLNVFVIEPAAGVDCSRLLDGTAEGYTPEKTISLDPQVMDNAQLNDVGPGIRLFYGEAEDQEGAVFLHGCTEAQAGDSGSPDVVVALVRTDLNPGEDHPEESMASDGGMESVDTLAAEQDLEDQEVDGSDSQPWWNPQWKARRKIFFLNSGQDEDLVDFPVLLMLNSDRIDYGRTQNLGEDLRFIDSDGNTVLSHEVEIWNKSGQSWIWVNVSKIDGKSDSDFIWMYYDNPQASSIEDPSRVWVADYRAVYHLDEGLTNSTGTPAAAKNFGATGVDGMIGRAMDFSGDDYIDLGADLDLLKHVSGGTLSAWVRLSQLTSKGAVISISIDSAGVTTNSRAAMEIQTDKQVILIGRSLDSTADTQQLVTTNALVTIDKWIYLTGVIDYANDRLAIYIDGVLATEQQAAFVNATSPDTHSTCSTIGSDDDGVGDNVYGIIDEVRISSAARSGDWIRAQYLSMTQGFLLFLPEEP